ncbi:tyrosinase family oxidase copper chaperone [Streptomyces sp. NPDC004838]
MPIPDRPGSRWVTRRIALRALFSLGVVAGTAGALAPLLGIGTPAPAAEDGERKAGGQPEPERFTEMYRGRRIEGRATVPIPAGGTQDTRNAWSARTTWSTWSGRSARRARDARDVRDVAAPSVEVRIDGRPLPIMRRADGGYLSLVNHYESFPTLREAARAAVDELGAAHLSMSPSHGH